MYPASTLMYLGTKWPKMEERLERDARGPLGLWCLTCFYVYNVPKTAWSLLVSHVSLTPCWSLLCPFWSLMCLFGSLCPLLHLAPLQRCLRAMNSSWSVKFEYSHATAMLL